MCTRVYLYVRYAGNMGFASDYGTETVTICWISWFISPRTCSGIKRELSLVFHYVKSKTKKSKTQGHQYCSQNFVALDNKQAKYTQKNSCWLLGLNGSRFGLLLRPRTVNWRRSVEWPPTRWTDDIL